MPAYEDAWYYLWKERRLPSNVDPLANKLDDRAGARLRFAQDLRARGSDKVVGHVLPLGRVRGGSGPGWVSGPWFLRQEHLYLMPGDSPIGLRLPLDSLPWARARGPIGEQPTRSARAATAAARARAAAPAGSAAAACAAGAPRRRSSRRGRAPRRPSDAAGDWLRAERKPGPSESAAWIVRTALCVEPRGGILHVFMPPLPYLEDYLELVAAIEDTAARHGHAGADRGLHAAARHRAAHARRSRPTPA